MLHTDDPDHKRLRDLVSKAFNQRSVDAMRTKIEAVANRLLDEIGDTSSFDVIEAYAKPLPTVVIAEMLGIDKEDQADFKRWSDTLVLVFNPSRTEEQLSDLISGRTSLGAYFADVIRKRRKERGTDLISTLIEAEEENQQLSEGEIINVCQILLVAGNVTTTDLIGNGVLALLQHPNEIAKLQTQPELVSSVVEEVLRYDPPVVQANRVTPSAMEIGGCPVAAGQTVSLSLLAANYDPSAHPNPKKFDVERPDKRHLSFGGGIHFCLGAPLARMEAQIALSLIFTRFPKLRLMPGHTPVRKALPTFNGLDSLWANSN
jgi:hypothetical protein